MKKILFALMGLIFAGGANAADITIFYAPTCPHCHHAREFISSTLIYEYDNLKVSEVDVTKIENRQAFVDALWKCGYQKGGVPVIVVGDVDAKDADLCINQGDDIEGNQEYSEHFAGETLDGGIQDR